MSLLIRSPVDLPIGTASSPAEASRPTCGRILYYLSRALNRSGERLQKMGAKSRRAVTRPSTPNSRKGSASLFQAGHSGNPVELGLPLLANCVQYAPIEPESLRSTSVNGSHRQTGSSNA